MVLRGIGFEAALVDLDKKIQAWQTDLVSGGARESAMGHTSALFGITLGLLANPAVATAGCFDLPNNPDYVTLCIDNECEESRVEMTCGNAFGTSFYLSNGTGTGLEVEDLENRDRTVSYAFSHEHGGQTGRYDSSRVTCFNWQLSYNYCFDLPTPCDPYLDEIRASFEAMPIQMRKQAQFALWNTNPMLPDEYAQAKPLLDGAWGPITENEIRWWCRGYVKNLVETVVDRPLTPSQAFQIPPILAAEGYVD